MGSDGRLVAWVSRARTAPGERDADGRLIAAAPDLLEACLQWQRLFVDFADEVELLAKGLPAQITVGDAIEKTKAAIAKAEGR
jgi:hypothetical protein